MNEPIDSSDLGAKKHAWNYEIHVRDVAEELAQRWCSDHRGITHDRDDGFTFPDDPYDDGFFTSPRRLDGQGAEAFAAFLSTDEGTYSALFGYAAPRLWPDRAALLAHLTHPTDWRVGSGVNARTIITLFDLALAELGPDATTDVILGATHPWSIRTGEASTVYIGLMAKLIVDLSASGRYADAARLLGIRIDQSLLSESRTADRWLPLVETYELAGDWCGMAEALKNRIRDLDESAKQSGEAYDARADWREVIDLLERAATTAPASSPEIDQIGHAPRLRSARCSAMWHFAAELLRHPDTLLECLGTARRAKALDDTLTDDERKAYDFRPGTFLHDILDRHLATIDPDYEVGPAAAYLRIYQAAGGHDEAHAHLRCAERHEWKKVCAFLDGRERHLARAEGLFRDRGDDRGLVDVALEFAILSGRVSFSFDTGVVVAPETAREPEGVIADCRGWYLDHDVPEKAVECLHTLADRTCRAGKEQEALAMYRQALGEYEALGGLEYSSGLCRKHIARLSCEEEQSIAELDEDANS